VHDGNQIVLQFHKDGANSVLLTDRFLWGPEVDQFLANKKVTSLSTAGTAYWTLADQLGTVRDLVTYDAGTDTTSHAKHRRFDSFGNVTFDSATSLVVTFGFTGKMFDTRTGLQWNINRWYDPLIGQWLSEDPIGFAGGVRLHYAPLIGRRKSCCSSDQRDEHGSKDGCRSWDCCFSPARSEPFNLGTWQQKHLAIARSW
jgi:RHS repeat-associated protein